MYINGYALYMQVHLTVLVLYRNRSNQLSKRKRAKVNVYTIYVNLKLHSIVDSSYKLEDW